MTGPIQMVMNLDEIRSTLFSKGLQRLLESSLKDDERIIWQGQPDTLADFRLLRFLWLIGIPCLILTYMARSHHWIDGAATPLALAGLAMMGGPFAMALYAMQTLFVITDRRAIILRTAWGKHTVASTALSGMDKLEILDVGGGAAHLNFTTRPSAKSPDADYTGRYGFRSIQDAEAVRAILKDAIGTRQRDEKKSKKY